MFERLITGVCRAAHRHPAAWLAVVAALCVPGWYGVQGLRLDTNLKRLLPQDSAAVQWSERLEGATGDRGYFSVLLEGEDPDVLRGAIVAVAEGIEALPGTRSAEYLNPVDFVERYGYTLLRADQLEEVLDRLYELEAEYSPLLADLGGEDAGDRSAGADEEEQLDRLLRYVDMPRFQQSDDGTVMGMIVRTEEGISDLGELRAYQGRIEAIAAEVADEAGLWWGVSGNLRNRVDEFDLIVADLQRAGTISLLAIVATLVVSFRAVRVLPVVLLPLATGLLWSFALVPVLVGELNTITSFLLMVLFGMGIDYAIHLVKRYRAERLEADDLEALLVTFRSTGRSVAVSGSTTALGLAILAVSDFRGFSDFGAIGGSSMVVVLLSMLLVLPATLVAGDRLGLVRARGPSSGRSGGFLPPRAVGVGLLVLVVAAGLVAWRALEFDYDFSSLSADVPGVEEIKERHGRVYSGFSAPGAVYVADDLEAADALVRRLQPLQEGPEPTVGEVTGIRDFVPTEEAFRRRVALVEEIRDVVAGRWTRKIEDEEARRLVEDVREFRPPPSPPTVDELPGSIRRGFMARDGSGYIVGVDTPRGTSKDGRMAMAFTADLYALDLPEGVRGPTGDRPVLAEILWMVTAESPWLVALTFAGIFGLVFADRRSVAETLWILLPLAAGLALTLGAMVALGWKLNFFNMVVLPTLLGISVDHGVHYYRRWRELGRHTPGTQRELFEPLTVCSATTVMGYVGMNFAHHPGLQAIGNLAVLGLACGWVTAVFLLPGLLRFREARRESRSAPARG